MKRRRTQSYEKMWSPGWRLGGQTLLEIGCLKTLPYATERLHTQKSGLEIGKPTTTLCSNKLLLSNFVDSTDIMLNRGIHRFSAAILWRFIICSLYQILGDRIKKEDKIGRACSVHGIYCIRNVYNNRSANLNRIDCLGEVLCQGVCVCVWAESIWLRIRSNGKLL
jgi:hypothetical protein